MIIIIKDIDFDFQEFDNAVRDAIKMKNRHLEDIFQRFEKVQTKVKQQLEELKNNDPNKNKVLYLTGVVDGINLIVEPFRRCKEEIDKL
ncbi:MAG TPA: hypothetical protein DCZ10_16085 [Pelotomaculum sp.]|nr:hypothetical protein [Pelotomaculum sp.]